MKKYELFPLLSRFAVGLFEAIYSSILCLHDKNLIIILLFYCCSG